MKIYVVGLIKNGNIYAYKIGICKNVAARLKNTNTKTFLFSKTSRRRFMVDVPVKLAKEIENAIKKIFRHREYKNNYGATEVFNVKARRDLIAAIEACIQYPDNIEEFVWLAAHGLLNMKTLPLVSLSWNKVCQIFDRQVWKKYFGITTFSPLDLILYRLKYARSKGAHVQVLLAQYYVIVDVTCNFYSEDAGAKEASKIYFSEYFPDRPLVFRHRDLMESYEEADDFLLNKDTGLRTMTFREKLDNKAESSGIWILNDSGRVVQGEFAEEFERAWRTNNFVHAYFDEFG